MRPTWTTLGLDHADVVMPACGNWPERADPTLGEVVRAEAVAAMPTHGLGR